MKACRHGRTWILAFGYIEWCYHCGAIRRMKPEAVENNTATVWAPASGWARAIPGQDSPFDKWQATFK